VLQRHYEIEIVGPLLGDGIWKPFASDKRVTFKPIDFNGGGNRFVHIKKLVQCIDGKVIYSSKPLLNSFGSGLIKKYFEHTPLILDIDDWQLGFIEYNNGDQFCKWTRKDYWACMLGERLSSLADEITVSSTFLQEKFGGTLICHARDTDFFNPLNYDKWQTRKQYDLDNAQKVIMFFGTPRSHKGMEVLIEAVSLIKDQNTLLVLVGIDASDPYCNRVVDLAHKILGKRFRQYGLQPFDKVPELLSTADVVVIPHNGSAAARGQVPAKVFDAMAMAKPIIATQVSDLPEILKDCGWLVEPDDPKKLSKMIECVLTNQSEAESKGMRARERCIAHYSWNAIESKLAQIFKKYE
jgi:glycosyltransferase involved in cell wall biosynthesis